MSGPGPSSRSVKPAAEGLKASARRVQEALDALGLDFELREFPAGTRSAAEAAAAIGCSLGQIAKSLVFRGVESDRPLLIVASGANRVDEAKAGRLLGEPLERADAAFVRARSGFAIGGVPPLGHLEPPLTLVDAALFRHDEIWAAAGTPNAVFRLTPEALVAITGGRVAEIAAAETGGVGTGGA